MSTKLNWIHDELDSLKQQNLYNAIRTIDSPQGAWLIVDGKRVLNFCSNNYLGLANDARLKTAAQAAITKFGVGPAAVRSIAGTLSLHNELERRLAEFKGVEATISFQSGFNSNGAVIPALVGKEDVIFSDELNHASIIDGARLSGAKIARYAHNDAEALEDAITKNAGTYRRALIVTDGVFSMDGDIAPLPQIVEVAERHDLMLMVDDAHGEGVLGRGGRGIVDHFGMHGRVDVEVGTLSKAFGVVGGYVAGKKKLWNGCASAGVRFCFPARCLRRTRQLVLRQWTFWKNLPRLSKNCGTMRAISKRKCSISVSTRARAKRPSHPSCSATRSSRKIFRARYSIMMFLRWQ